MLKAHLSEKYLHYHQKQPLPSIVPTTPRMTNQCCFGKPFSTPVISSARSPSYKRKKIFQNFKSPESKITAKFNSLAESTVQPYSVVHNPSQNIALQVQTFRKKLRTNKENGLNFEKKHTMQLKKQIEKKTWNFKSQGNIQRSSQFNEYHNNQQNAFEPSNKNGVIKTDESQHNRSLLKSFKDEQIRMINSAQQESLIIQHYTPTILTFNSEKSSLSYSNTNYRHEYMQESQQRPHLVHYSAVSKSRLN